MATLKQRLHRKNADGSYDVVHLETSASLVKRANGSNVEESLTTIESWDLLKYEDAGTMNGIPYITETLPAHQHVVADITDFPTSLPASDVYSWAKAASKPTYTYSEVGAAAANHTHDNYASKEWCEQIIGASTNGYSYTYTAEWNTYNRSAVVPTSSGTNVDEILLYSLDYTQFLEFDPTSAKISANISLTMGVTECPNISNISTANPNTNIGTFNNSEIYANGSEVSVAYSQLITWVSPTMTFRMASGKLMLYFILSSVGMLAGQGTTIKYYINGGSADITVKFMR